MLRALRRNVGERGDGDRKHKEPTMARTTLFAGVAAAAILAAITATPAPALAQTASAAVQIDDDDIGGTVTGPSGPEAGVWVIAETTDLPTKFAKIVVTDDQG